MSNLIGLSRRTTHRVWHSRFARNVVLVASGTVGAQAIGMAFAPFITRVYGPDAFGLLGIFTSIVAIVTPVVALAYPIAIVLPRDDGDALGLVRLSVLLSVGITLLATMLLVCGGDWLMTVLGADPVAKYWFFIPLTMFFAAWMQIANQWLIRKKEFGTVAWSAVVSSLILNGAKISISLFYPIGVVLIGLSTFGNALQAALLLMGIRKQHRKGTVSIKKGPRTPLKELALRHYDFPLYRAPQIFINAASQSLPALMLAAFFGPVSVGFYTLTQTVLGIPNTLVGNAVSAVFYPRITEAAHAGENLLHHVVQATGILLVIGILPFGLVILFGPWLFGFVFGSEWTTAGEYARWLALFFLFNFINKPCVTVVPVIGIQRGFLCYELFSTGAKALALVTGFYWFGSAIWAVALFAISGAIAYAIMILWIIFRAMRWSVSKKTG